MSSIDFSMKTVSGRGRSKGFTLIEILLVIAIIAVLATVVVVALDPVRRFQDARDTRRVADIESIMTAVQQYVIDNRGVFPPGVDTLERQIGTAVDGCDMAYGICSVNLQYCLDLSAPLAKYLKSTPYDPGTGSVERTHYSIQLDENNVVTVRACDALEAAGTSISR